MNKLVIKKAACAVCYLLLSVFSSTAIAEEVDVQARAKVSGPEVQADNSYFVPKQTLSLDITSLTSTWLAGAPVYPDWSVPGAQVLKSQSQGLSVIERQNGSQYVGVKHRFLMVPLTTGSLSLPPSEILLSSGRSTGKQRVSVESEPFEVRLPEGAESLESFLPATRLSVTDTTDINTDGELRVGDAVTREITVSVDGTMGTFIPAFHVGELPEGLTFYPGQTRVGNTVTGRGDFQGGYRTQTLTYLAEHEGTYTLSGFTLRWWNLSNSRFETTEIKPLTFTVRPVRISGAEQQLQLPVYQRLFTVVENNKTLTTLFILMSLFLVRFRQSLSTRLIGWGEQIWRLSIRLAASEAVVFTRLQVALLAGRDQRSRYLFFRWLRCCSQSHNQEQQTLESVGVREWLSGYYSPLTNHAESRKPDRLLLMRALYRARQSLSKNHVRLLRKRNRFALPELNPADLDGAQSQKF